MGTGICPWCGKEVDKFIMFRGDVVGCRYCGIHTKQTNADRIRTMTDEELKDFLVRTMTCTACAEMHGGRCPKPKDYKEKKCGDMILDWLRQEAET